MYAIEYFSGFTLIRQVYYFTRNDRIRGIARTTLNCYSVFMTLPAWGFESAMDFLQVGRLEELVFGERVYIFNDNRILIESNFTAAAIQDVADAILEGGN
jgi:hypothetical protein